MLEVAMYGVGRGGDAATLRWPFGVNTAACDVTNAPVAEFLGEHYGASLDGFGVS